MRNEHLFEVDESVERALRDEGSLDGKMDLLADMQRGHHARTVIAEMNHAHALKEAGEQVYDPNKPFKFELQGILHGQGFHQIALQEGSYDVWDTDQSDRLEWIKKKFPENRLRHRSRTTTIVVGNKYGPPTL